ncbi:LysR family transcriptional regulator [Acinetobacter courvalinii]|jgi:DNA-binding transcriptional LysR family regulator|uniref:LysR family transcriptional regulator n=1 Tax=Acinetobacter TaxID=469 RepID=UPI0021CD9ECB|nr:MULTISPECIES: LysR family transcriptional regulator [Acinetobacter]MCU4391241.1 LysR family transcriptional regulator [Acinetobacter courvalinii]MDR2062309.1 LysR family transcriptional regulator [Acinetobacter sp.]
MWTFKQFNYLITIVETGGFIAASEKLFIAQSALSRQIKNLEEELGFEIFDRSEKKIKLTVAGEALYKSLKTNLDHLKSSIVSAQSISRGEGRIIKIAHSSSIVLDQNKLEVFEQLCDTHNIDIEMNTLSSELQFEYLLDGSIDLGFIRPPIYHNLDEVNSISLYTAPLYVAAHIADPVLSEKENISIRELASLNFVSVPHKARGGLSYLAANLCLVNGFSPKRTRIYSRKRSQLELVANGFGICIVPEEFKVILPSNVRLIPIQDENTLSEVKLIWKKDEDLLIDHCAASIHAYYSIKQMN